MEFLTLFFPKLTQATRDFRPIPASLEANSDGISKRRQKLQTYESIKLARCREVPVENFYCGRIKKKCTMLYKPTLLNKDLYLCDRKNSVTEKNLSLKKKRMYFNKNVKS